MSDFQLYIQVNHLSLNFILNNHFYAPGIEVIDSLCFPVYKIFLYLFFPNSLTCSNSLWIWPQKSK